MRERASVQTIAWPRAEAAAAKPGPVAAPAPRQDRLFAERMGPQLVASNVVPIGANRQRIKTATNSSTGPVAPHVQEQFNFPSPAPQRKTLSTTVEATIFCEDPVATPVHRSVAAALDLSMVLIGYGLFTLVFHFMGGIFDLQNSVNRMAFAGMLALIGLAYGATWAVVGRRDSPGMRWTQLRITTFDGDPPEPRRRILRFIGSCLSVCTLVGLLWSLADEESLTWQDHISSTFPTPIPLRRRN
jgi:uncharacterized RDD family membrane protein YckC